LSCIYEKIVNCFHTKACGS